MSPPHRTRWPPARGASAKVPTGEDSRPSPSCAPPQRTTAAAPAFPSAAAEGQHRDGADAGGLLLVLGEAGVAAGLLGVDAVALVALQFGDGDRVSLGADLDLTLAGGDEVVVP